MVVPHCDIGTGIYTSLSQMAADELDADWSKVRAETAPADPLFANSAMAEGFALEELNVPGDRVPTYLRGTTVNSLRILAEYMDLQTTGGSSAVRFTGVYGTRVAGAAVREMLVKAAAARMNAPIAEFRTEMSRVIHILRERASATANSRRRRQAIALCASEIEAEERIQVGWKARSSAWTSRPR